MAIKKTTTPTGLQVTTGADGKITGAKDSKGTYGIDGKPVLSTPTAPKAPTMSTGIKAAQPTTTAPTNTIPSSQVAKPTTPTTPTAPSQYTPPNQGKTGISQGGVIGNLINFGQNESAQVRQARENLQSLENEYAQSDADVLSRPMGLTQQTGQQGILAGLFAKKQAAAQDAVQNALTSQSQQISAMQGAGTLNAPQFVAPGQLQINPSAPGPGQLTSGASSLQNVVGTRDNSLGIGTRLSKDGKTTEYFNKETGVGFPTAQALADFMNKRQPNLGANAANVFDIIKKKEYFNKDTGQGFKNPEELAAFVNAQLGNNSANAANVFDLINQSGSSQSNMLGVPDNLIQTYAQLLTSGQQNLIPASVTGNIALMAQVYQAAQAMSGGSFNANQAAAQGVSIGELTQQRSQLQSVLSGADANFELAINTARAGGINSNDVPILNTLEQNVAQNLTSSAAVNNFRETLATVRSQYATILGGGNTTVESLQQAQSIIPDNISIGALQSLAIQMKTAASNRLAGIDSQINALKGVGNSGNTSGGGGGDPLGLGI